MRLELLGNDYGDNKMGKNWDDPVAGGLLSILCKMDKLFILKSILAQLLKEEDKFNVRHFP